MQVNGCPVPCHAALSHIGYETDDGSRDDHRVETDEASLEKMGSTHLSPTVIIGIANDKARKDKKEVNSQITMIEALVERTGSKCFKHMIPHDQ